MAARRGGFQQLQRAVKQGHVPVRRDNIGAVGLDRHAVRNFEDLHAGITLDQFGEDALVVRSQVLHQDESHTGIGVGGHAGKEGFKCRQSPGRRADADHGESRTVMPGWRLRRYRYEGSCRLLRLALFCRHDALLPFPATLASSLSTFRNCVGTALFTCSPRMIGTVTI
jgi:hypothetical protein